MVILKLKGHKKIRPSHQTGKKASVSLPVSMRSSLDDQPNRRRPGQSKALGFERTLICPLLSLIQAMLSSKIPHTLRQTRVRRLRKEIPNYRTAFHNGRTEKDKVYSQNEISFRLYTYCARFFGIITFFILLNFINFSHSAAP